VTTGCVGSIRAVPRRRDVVGSAKRRVDGVSTSAHGWYDRNVTGRRASNPLLDFGLRFVERDRDADASVTASAVSLRIFLFFVPLLLVIVGTIGFLKGHIAARDVSSQAGVTGGLADQIDTALHQSNHARWLAVGSGLLGAFLAGRNLSRVLATASRRAWQVPSSTAPTSVTRVTGAVTGLMTSVGMLAVIVNRVRRATGVVGGSVAFVPVAFAYAFVWFLVCAALPRQRTDKTVLLPGAALVGVALATLQWLLQFQAPSKLSRASELYGAIGIAVVALGWFFLVGRVFVASFAFNAVLWEQYGSVANWLNGRRRIGPMLTRHPRVNRFLGLASADDADADEGDGREGSSRQGRGDDPGNVASID
jgi:membrane protein